MLVKEAEASALARQEYQELQKLLSDLDTLQALLSKQGAETNRILEQHYERLIAEKELFIQRMQRMLRSSLQTIIRAQTTGTLEREAAIQIRQRLESVLARLDSALVHGGELDKHIRAKNWAQAAQLVRALVRERDLNIPELVSALQSFAAQPTSRRPAGDTSLVSSYPFLRTFDSMWNWVGEHIREPAMEVEGVVRGISIGVSAELSRRGLRDRLFTKSPNDRYIKALLISSWERNEPPGKLGEFSVANDERGVPVSLVYQGWLPFPHGFGSNSLVVRWVTLEYSGEALMIESGSVPPLQQSDSFAIITSNEPDAKEVRADAEELFAQFRNIKINAIRATQSGSTYIGLRGYIYQIEADGHHITTFTTGSQHGQMAAASIPFSTVGTEAGMHNITEEYYSYAGGQTRGFVDTLFVRRDMIFYGHVRLHDEDVWKKKRTG